MKTKFNMIMIIKIQCLVTSIKNYFNISYEDAMDELYHSDLYKLLEIEDTKMWYFSNHDLFNMFKEEKETGKFSLEKYNG